MKLVSIGIRFSKAERAFLRREARAHEMSVSRLIFTALDHWLFWDRPEPDPGKPRIESADVTVCAGVSDEVARKARKIGTSRAVRTALDWFLRRSYFACRQDTKHWSGLKHLCCARCGSKTGRVFTESRLCRKCAGEAGIIPFPPSRSRQ